MLQELKSENFATFVKMLMEFMYWNFVAPLCRPGAVDYDPKLKDAQFLSVYEDMLIIFERKKHRRGYLLDLPIVLVTMRVCLEVCVCVCARSICVSKGRRGRPCSPRGVHSDRFSCAFALVLAVPNVCARTCACMFGPAGVRPQCLDIHLLKSRADSWRHVSVCVA